MTYHVCMSAAEYVPVRLKAEVRQSVGTLARQLSAALDDDLSLSDAIGVSVGYGLANLETLVQWARDQRPKGSDH